MSNFRTTVLSISDTHINEFKEFAKNIGSSDSPNVEQAINLYIERLKINRDLLINAHLKEYSKNMEVKP